MMLSYRTKQTLRMWIPTFLAVLIVVSFAMFVILSSESELSKVDALTEACILQGGTPIKLIDNPPLCVAPGIFINVDKK